MKLVHNICIHYKSAPPSKNTVLLYMYINIVDTSIKHPISGQSTTVVKGCMYIMFDMVDIVFSYPEEHWSSANFFRDFRR